MSGKYGTKETQDLLDLVKVTAICILKEVKKDGFQPADLGAFLKSADFEAALKPALENVALVPVELTELDLWDDLALAKYGYGVWQEVQAELKAVVKK